MLKNSSDSSYPLVTIGITCYNTADVIDRAIKSACQQTWPNLEIIIVDDGSTDNSSAIVQRWALLDCRIKFIPHDKNRGFPAALNTIIKNSTGEYIAFFDDDDESVPDRISKQFRRIQEYTQVINDDFVLCYSNRNVVKLGKVEPDHIAFAIGRHPPEPYGKIVADFIFGYDRVPFFTWGMFGSCTLMASRATFLKIGDFDESFRRAAELDMAIRAAFLNAHFIAVDEPLIAQYKILRPERSKKKNIYYFFQLIKKYKPYLKGEHTYLVSYALAKARWYDASGKKFLQIILLIMACLLRPRRLIKKVKQLLLKT
jgi:glycosyltransferase involved in cell wall biosynthesis